MSGKLVGINEKGLRVGEDHHRAKLTDHDVELIRELHEEHGLGYRTLAKKFEVSRSLIRHICKYTLRCQFAAAWKKVPG